MTDPDATRVAVYIDFDNIVISHYDHVHGRNAFSRDRARQRETGSGPSPEMVDRLEQATVDVGAVLDFASSYGTIVLTRAYADWSATVNARYQRQLVGRAVDLVQLFPAAAYAKNGADIRLAVDAVEDMFRLPDLTHVVIVAGDSDYVPLAQRCKRLGRYVVGIGVAGSTSKSLGAACDELVTYGALPGIAEEETRVEDEPAPAPVSRPDPVAVAGPTSPAELSDEDDDEDEPDATLSRRGATRLLERALRLAHEREDDDWLHASEVKTQMKRMDPSFSEKSLGYRSFSEFVKSRNSVAELDETDQTRLIRLRPDRNR
ncbi:NYN domain-containing protein [Auraticoccus monumenti]|uniref:OST-HTH/LOTUS domain-containing protein n=1 Tax=Auraticoccus monumenti TaxID=675864 RepID=A0A1G7E238_9ACTN|nr:NYN domain-containing protein [Auraticoccus monumenti]SDE57702.1 OST-HTH/LOTUS domain-containing protein [Auraticoccus monumenti]